MENVVFFVFLGGRGELGKKSGGENGAGTGCEISPLHGCEGKDCLR